MCECASAREREEREMGGEERGKEEERKRGREGKEETLLFGCRRMWCSTQKERLRKRKRKKRKKDRERERERKRERECELRE